MKSFARLHVLRDAVRRSRIAWLWVGLIVLAVWGLVAAGLDARAGVATSLTGVFVLGPMTSLTSVVAREIRFLPVTSRDVWVVAWVLTSVVATLFVGALQAITVGIGTAAGLPQPQPLTSLPFVTLCAFVYGGVLLPVGPLIGYTSHAATERRPKWLWVVLATLALLTYFGGLVVPWAAWSMIPTSFDGLSGWSWSVLMVGALAAISAFTWTPQRFGGSSRPVAAARTTTPPTARAQAGPAPVPRRLDRLTGLKRLLLPTLAWTFTLMVTGIVVVALYFITFEPSRSLYESFAAVGLLPFSAGGFSENVVMGTALFVPFIAISSGAGWTGYTRHLRVLPLSALETTGLLIGTTMLLWTLVWVVLAGSHLLVLGTHPPTVRLELFAYAAGLSALAETFFRTRRKPGRAFPFGVILVLFAMGIFEGLSGRHGTNTMFWMHAAVGAAALVISALVNYRSLTRSTSSAGTYRPSPSFKV